jgi:hypothetical protein
LTVGFGLDATGPHDGSLRDVITLVLVGVGLGERVPRAVEAVALAR